MPDDCHCGICENARHETLLDKIEELIKNAEGYIWILENDYDYHLENEKELIKEMRKLL